MFVIIQRHISQLQKEFSSNTDFFVHLQQLSNFFERDPCHWDATNIKKFTFKELLIAKISVIDIVMSYEIHDFFNKTKIIGFWNEKVAAIWRQFWMALWSFISVLSKMALSIRIKCHYADCRNTDYRILL